MSTLNKEPISNTFRYVRYTYMPERTNGTNNETRNPVTKAPDTSNQRHDSPHAESVYDGGSWGSNEANGKLGGFGL